MDTQHILQAKFESSGLSNDDPRVLFILGYLAYLTDLLERNMHRGPTKEELESAFDDGLTKASKYMGLQNAHKLLDEIGPE